MQPRGIVTTAVILLGLGVERLLNFYLLGGDTGKYPVPFTVGVGGIVLGVLLLVVTGYARLLTRR